MAVQGNLVRCRPLDIGPVVRLIMKVHWNSRGDSKPKKVMICKQKGRNKEAQKNVYKKPASHTLAFAPHKFLFVSNSSALRNYTDDEYCVLSRWVWFYRHDPPAGRSFGPSFAPYCDAFSEDELGVMLVMARPELE